MTTPNVFFPTVGKSISCVQLKLKSLSNFFFVFVWATKRFPVHVREVEISNNIARLMGFRIVKKLKNVIKIVLRDTIIAIGWGLWRQQMLSSLSWIVMETQRKDSLIVEGRQVMHCKIEFRWYSDDDASVSWREIIKEYVLLVLLYIEEGKFRMKRNCLWAKFQSHRKFLDWK